MPETDLKLQKLERIVEALHVLNDSITKDEFIRSFKAVLAVVNEMKVENKETVADLEKKYEGLMLEHDRIIKEYRDIANEYSDITLRIKENNDANFTDLKERSIKFLKDQLDGELKRLRSESDKWNKECDDIMTRMKEHETEMNAMGVGQMENMQKEHESMMAKMEEKMQNIKDGSPDTGVDIVNKINELPIEEEYQIEKEHIKGLVEMLEELSRNKGIRFGGGFSQIHMEQHFIDDETPTGTINGINTVFTIASTPNPSGSLKVYVNGQRMRITEDYTVSGRTITFLIAPPTTSIILCDYRK